jgi:hypothetical protein
MTARLAPKAVRAAAIAHSGGKCWWCQATWRLEFDHLKDDGAAHRRELGHTPLEVWLQQQDWPVGVVRLICRACHELRTLGMSPPGRPCNG